MKRGTRVQHFGIRKFNLGVASGAIVAGIFFGSDAVLASAEEEMQQTQEETSITVEDSTHELPDFQLEELPQADTQTPELASFPEDTSKVEGVVEDEIADDQFDAGQKEEQEQRPAEETERDINDDTDTKETETIPTGTGFRATGEPEVSDKPFEGQVGVKEASENTFAEDLGETGPGYNFADLKFNPENLDQNNDINEANFEMYGKHNIAASTNNWVINLQLDERLAQYIENIHIDSKRTGLIGGNRMTLVRKNDVLGRPTNLWQVNYIRASNGLFAGGETTDTQTAPNGVIHFEKPVNEILAEIGNDELTSKKLLYRVYLTSNRDDGKIVSGIDLTGYFKVNGIDDYEAGELSENNMDWFKLAGGEQT